jgi:hypothetical protein
MLIQSRQAHYLYNALFDWQPPLSLWERSESLKKLLGDEILTLRDAGNIEIKKILEAWVTGKSLTMAYHGERCLVRLSPVAAMDAQIYRNSQVQSVEVTQALYPGRKRNVFGKRYAGFMPFEPLAPHEQEAYEIYREGFIRQAFLQVEARIEHKFQLYKTLDYLLVYVDLFDTHNPRFGYFALQEFAEDYSNDLQARLDARFRSRWCDKIGYLFLLDDKPTGFVTHFASLPNQTALHDQLSLA